MTVFLNLSEVISTGSFYLIPTNTWTNSCLLVARAFPQISPLRHSWIAKTRCVQMFMPFSPDVMPGDCPHKSIGWHRPLLQRWLDSESYQRVDDLVYCTDSKLVGFLIAKRLGRSCQSCVERCAFYASLHMWWSFCSFMVIALNLVCFWLFLCAYAKEAANLTWL